MDSKGQQLSMWPFELSVGSTAIVVLVPATLLYIVYRSLLPRPLPGIPYDKNGAKSLLGDIPDIIAHAKKTGSVLSWFPAQNLKHNAPLVQFSNPFPQKQSLILADFQEIQDIMIRRTKEFDRSQDLINIFRGGAPDHHISMKTADPRFKGNKELVRDLMSPAFLHSTSAEEIYLKTMSMVKLWTFKARSAGGRAFDSRPDVQNAAIDMVNAAAFAFNESLSSTKHQLDYLESLDNFRPNVCHDGTVEFPQLPHVADIATLLECVEYTHKSATSPMPSLLFSWLWYTDPNLRRVMAKKDQIVAREIRKSLSRLEMQNDDGVLAAAVDNVLRREKTVATKEGRKPDFFSGRIKDELFGYVLAGQETTQTAIVWTLRFLGEHQDVQQKLREEMKLKYAKATVESRLPTASEIVNSNIPYFDAVIEESLRVGNPIRILHREATVDTVLLGHHVPKGTTVFFSSTGAGFWKPSFPVDDSLRSDTSGKYQGGQWNPLDMHLFNPDRWLRENEQHEIEFNPNAGPALHFSLGPRGCFGKKLAYLELRLVITLLVWNFHFKQLDNSLISDECDEGITTIPTKGYVVLELLD